MSALKVFGKDKYDPAKDEHDDTAAHDAHWSSKRQLDLNIGTRRFNQRLLGRVGD